MDTNTEPQINSFAGGLNSDDDISVVATNQYLEARNLRITSYDKDNKHGSISSIKGVRLAGSFPNQGYKIVATGSIRDYGVIVCKSDSRLKIYTFKNAIGQDLHTQEFNEITNKRTVVDAPLLETDGQSYPDVFNIQLNYESENNIKLYLADSIHPIMIFNINRSDNFIYSDLNKCLIYPETTCEPPVFEDYIPGKLEFSVVSYCYQLYNKHGIYTDASIQCKQIPIGNYNFDESERFVQSGGKQEAQSNCGVKISINIPSEYSHLDKIKVFRVQYTQNGQMPIVSVIYDANIDFSEDLNTKVVINDVGATPIAQISVEELNSLQGVRIIPNSLAVKDGLLFAANIKTVQTSIKDFDKWDARAFRFNSNKISVVSDVNGNDKFKIDASKNSIDDSSVSVPNFTHDCYDSKYNDINTSVSLGKTKYIYDSECKWVGGSGKNIEWRFVISPQVEDSCIKGNNERKIGTLYNYSKKENIKQTDILYVDKDFHVVRDSANFDAGINNNTWLLKSLRRNEIYRYGIVLYDKYGQASPAKWIADIRTPNMTDRGFELFQSNTIVNGKRYELVIRNLGIQFKVKNLPEGCIGYQIVRCARHESDMATISQGVLSSPVSNAYSKNFSQDGSYDITKYHTFCPTGFLTTGKIITGFNCPNQLDGDGDDNGSQCMTNLDNYDLLQFVSKEVCYQPESFKSFIKDKKYYLDKQSFLFGARGDYKFNDWEYDSPNNKRYYNIDADSRSGVFNFITPCISNCSIEIWPGPYSNGVRSNITVNGSTINGLNTTYVSYIDTAFNPDYFYMINPCSYQDKLQGSSSGNGMVGGYGIDRWRSYALIKDCILDFDRLYKEDNEVIYKRSELKGKYVIQKAFAYIKLYEQNDQALKFGSTNSWVNEPTYCPISDFNVVEQIKWDEAFKRNQNKDGEEQTSSKAFTNKATSSGGTLFVNMITSGLCNDTNKNIASWFGHYGGSIKKTTKWWESTDSGKEASFGTGGKCLLLSCDYKDLGTIGTSSFLTSSDGTCFSDLHYESSQNDPVTQMIIRPSLLGTYLTNLRQQVSPYGGAAFINRLTNVYYGDGDYFKSAGDWCTVFNGDCHVETFEYTSMHKIYGAYTQDSKDNLQFPGTHMITYSIPTESNIWDKFQYGWQFSVNAKDNYASFIQSEPCQITEAYVQEDPQYVYNSVYSVQNTSTPLSIYDDLNSEDYNKTVDTRVYYSDLKQNDEVIDSWARFKSSNFIDVDQQYGPITDIFTFKNQLLFFQENAVGVLSVNDRSVTTDNSGQDIVLGSGGVLSRYDYYSNTYGMHKQQFCVTSTTGGLYWFDSHNNTICTFDGQRVIQLSKQGKVQMLLNKYKKDDSFHIYYDNRYNEIVFDVLSDNMQISFSEMIGKFTSLYTLPFEGCAQFMNGGYLINTNDMIDVFQYDCVQDRPISTTGQYLSSYLKYVVNQQPLITKVFDNQQIVTADDLQDKPIYDTDDYFSKNHSYTWATPLISSESTLSGQITLRENNHKFAIPRSGGLFGGRIRGNYMTCEISNDSPNPVTSVQYIITKYRQSWS